MDLLGKNQSLWIFVLLTTLALLLTGCAAGTKTRYATSVVDYLYPNSKDPVVKPSIPVLSLPMRVGIAFVPAEHGRQHGGHPYFFRQRAHFALTEKNKMDLMKEVANHFKKYPFVKSIEIIPSAYLTPRGSFTNLDQLRTLYGIDAIVLLSYDQVQFTDEGLLSFTYWTIIGAYIVPGEKNDTHTMLDAVIYDIPSRKMLFRAPGSSHIKGRATAVNLSEELRKDSEAGFVGAAKQMIVNLDQQLVLFKEKVKESPKEYKVVHRPGYTGVGSLDWFVLLLLLGLGGSTLWLRRK